MPTIKMDALLLKRNARWLMERREELRKDIKQVYVENNYDHFQALRQMYLNQGYQELGYMPTENLPGRLKELDIKNADVVGLTASYEYPRQIEAHRNYGYFHIFVKESEGDMIQGDSPDLES